ncbi:hypothetical protein HPB48_017483 [Haemaphysalis longicornis]|uniref:C2H2-type domain-containing protein n=1 Tax=Haemaphysalis longicornis TaxID=44386 RepID=A0A9J6FR80_HAELO|nr:hypothetical protein HPB48_017483 [Haemaphysalis longicornis]
MFTSLPLTSTQNCSICRNTRDHPRSSRGHYSCSHCEWKSLSLARLKLHHLENHSSHENATVSANRTQRDGGHQEGNSAKAGHPVSSSQRDNSRQSSGSGSDTSVDAGVTESPPCVDTETGHAVRASRSRTSQVACPQCGCGCTTPLTLRLHHIAKHDGIPFVDPTDESLPAKKIGSASDQASRKNSCKMYGYRRDGFVCSDTSSSVSYDEYSSGPDEASSDATAVTARTHDSTDTSGDETVVLSGNEEAAVCDRCHEQLSSKLDLAAHLRRVHKVRVFCSYCGHGSREAQLLRHHHRRNHQRRPFKYLHLNNGKLVHVTEVDSEEWEEESADESTCLLAKLPEVSENQPKKAPRKKPPTAPRPHRKGHGKARHASSQKMVLVLSSSSEEEEEEVSSVQIVPSISRNVYFGYRCPKSVSAFQTLMDNVSDVFKCSAFSCGYSTNVSLNFERHLAGHRPEDVFCMYCGANVSHPGALVTHLEQEHSGLRHQCMKCLYRAGFTPYFEVHFLLAHPGETVAHVSVFNGRGVEAPAPPEDRKAFRPYECGFAGCSFKEKNRQAFARHFEEVHAGESSFPCFVCDRNCKLVSNLLEHLQEHGLADLQCCYCSFGTLTTTSMMLHACYTHAGQFALFAMRNSNLGEKVITSSNDVGPLSVVFSDETTQLVFEQRCCFCPSMVAGFSNLQTHTETVHALSLSPEELAERLFGMYDYTEALKLGRCPFCPYVGDKVADLQHHVLRQELQISNFLCSACKNGFEDQLSWQQHIDCGQCPATAMLQLCNNGQLLHWVRENLPFRIPRFQCPLCPQTFRVASTFHSHLSRHYTYYPVTCKLCNAPCQGIRGREQHLRVSHGAGGEDVGAGEVEAEVARQAALCSLPEAQTCPHCGFHTVSEKYHVSHVARCAVTEHLPVAGDGSDSEEDVKPIYHCMHCSVSFIYLERLLSHGYVQHGCSWFCTVCYQGYETELGCLEHCKDPGCKWPGTMFLVERGKEETVREGVLLQ